MCQAFERLYAGGRWHAVLVAAHLATGESEHAEQRGSGREPRAEGRKGGGCHDKAPARRGGGLEGAKVVSTQARCKVLRRFIYEWYVGGAMGEGRQV
ncbi:hypothetical protein PPUJ20066_48420 [Pseudomonas putida]|nr:hypothetical protein PPUJ20066_48420 [Pseudomonas putida]